MAVVAKIGNCTSKLAHLWAIPTQSPIENPLKPAKTINGMPLEGLNSLIKGLETQPGWQARRQFRQVVTHWPKAVGYAVACQTRPVSIKRNVLYVTVASAAWAQTLGFERTRILRKLNKHLSPTLQDIRFSTAQWTQKTTKPRGPISDELKNHPSYLEPINRERLDADNGLRAVSGGHLASSQQVQGLKTGSAEPVQTADEAFQKWANLIQVQQKQQSTCPKCQCHCPPGELKRWQLCALCAAKKWK
ncbi:MAG: DUF721 domain-containing protein [Cyanobacteria bacterium J06635_1]